MTADAPKRTQHWFGPTTPRRPLSQCSVCGTPAPGRPFCPRDGALIAGPFTVADRYLVEERLGHGGMAYVFAARHKLMGKTVALKALKPTLTPDPLELSRFLREAQMSSQLAHENIVGVIDYGRDEALDLTFLVMERLHGRTLAQVMADDGPLPWQRVVAILQQVCRAVVVAHAAGVIHRDLTPANVMLVEASGRHDVVKLCDFGLALPLATIDRMTVPGTLLGTPAYMAPEQVRGEPQDERVDLYAIGGLAFEMLTGQLPLEATTVVGLIAAKLTDDVRPFAVRFPDLQIPPALEQLVLRCLARDPAGRPQSASQIERALAAIGTIPPAVTPPVLVAPTVVRDTPTLVRDTVAVRRQPSRYLTIFFAGLMAAGVVGALALAVRHRTGAPPAVVANTPPEACAPTARFDEPRRLVAVPVVAATVPTNNPTAKASAAPTVRRRRKKLPADRGKPTKTPVIVNPFGE